MFAPVLCDCGQVYDSGTVTIIARYADCSMWRTPCCGRTEDDRPWPRHYQELESVNSAKALYGPDRDGVMIAPRTVTGPDGKLYRVKERR